MKKLQKQIDEIKKQQDDLGKKVNKIVEALEYYGLIPDSAIRKIDDS